MGLVARAILMLSRGINLKVVGGRLRHGVDGDLLVIFGVLRGADGRTRTDNLQFTNSI